MPDPDGAWSVLCGCAALAPAGSVMGYMPELNALLPIGDYGAKSRQPVMKHVAIEVRSQELGP